MTEPNVIEMKSPDKKRAKVRLEVIDPIMILSVWHLSEPGIRSSHYPDFTEETKEALQSFLHVDLNRPGFSGLMAKIGKRPVGLIWGLLEKRDYGKPAQVISVKHFWVDTPFRRQGIGKSLAGEYKKKLNQAGFFHFEKKTESEEEFILFQKLWGTQVGKLYTVIGGRL